MLNLTKLIYYFMVFGGKDPISLRKKCYRKNLCKDNYVEEALVQLKLGVD